MAETFDRPIFCFFYEKTNEAVSLCSFFSPFCCCTIFITTHKNWWCSFLLWAKPVALDFWGFELSFFFLSRGRIFDRNTGTSSASWRARKKQEVVAGGWEWVWGVEEEITIKQTALWYSQVSLWRDGTFQAAKQKNERSQDSKSRRDGKCSSHTHNQFHTIYYQRSGI